MCEHHGLQHNVSRKGSAVPRVPDDRRRGVAREFVVLLVELLGLAHLIVSLTPCSQHGKSKSGGLYTVDTEDIRLQAALAPAAFELDN